MRRNKLTGKKPEAAVAILEEEVNKLRYASDKESFQGFLEFFYPVGSYYETSDASFDPNESWGGTWEKELEGQVHVGAGSTYSINGALVQDGGTSDGGAKEVTLTSAQSGMPSHGHGFTAPTVDGGYTSNGISGGGVTNGITGGSHHHGMGERWSSGSGSNTMYTQSSNRKGTTIYTDDEDGHIHNLPSHNHDLPDHSHTVSGGGVIDADSLNASSAHNNMQPYIVVNRWHRTA